MSTFIVQHQFALLHLAGTEKKELERIAPVL